MIDAVKTKERTWFFIIISAKICVKFLSLAQILTHGPDKKAPGA